jgi:nanoRNase/pAp phosphatase (c-di-AMP/oligoRNAs hydrolase)
MASHRPKRSDRLLHVLEEYQSILIVAHNNPDPDAIAAGWALLVLVKEHLRRPVRFVGRGPILRAENLQFLKLLQPPIELIEDIEVGPHTATVLIDCAAGSLNHLLAGKSNPVAVIDHHESKCDGLRIPFRDIRPRITAAATIAALYLREQGHEPGPEMATALLYAIRTEMQGAHSALSAPDHTALRWLSGYAEFDVLSDIENAPLPRHYYEELLLALNSVLVYADSVLCFRPRITGPEILGEVADLLIRGDGLNYVLCGGKHGGEFLLSARSKRKGADAVSLLRHVLRDLGHCGGHRHRAGGKIEASIAACDTESLERELKTRWLDACNATRRRGQRLVGRKEITRPG